jgi:hypothetical protein
LTLTDILATKGVIQTATAESRVVTYLQQKTSSESASTPNLPELIPALLTTIEINDGTPEEPALAAGRLPKDFATTVDEMAAGGQTRSAWTEVCLVKGCYIKGTL